MTTPSLMQHVVAAGFPADADMVHLFIGGSQLHGAKVVGYLYWSLTDTFEWGSYSPRFGLYTVDVLTDPDLVRRPTQAVAVYRDIIHANGIDPDYAPRLSPDCIEYPLALGCLAPGL